MEMRPRRAVHPAAVTLPIAPHIAHTLARAQVRRRRDACALAPSRTRRADQDEVEYVLQVNGKKKGSFSWPKAPRGCQRTLASARRAASSEITSEKKLSYRTPGQPCRLGASSSCPRWALAACAFAARSALCLQTLYIPQSRAHRRRAQRNHRGQYQHQRIESRRRRAARHRREAAPS